MNQNLERGRRLRLASAFLSVLLVVVTLLGGSRGNAQPTPQDPVEFQVNAYTACSQRSPSVSSTLDGGFVVVWESCGSPGSDSDGGSIQFRRFDAAARAVDPIEIPLVKFNVRKATSTPRCCMAARGSGVKCKPAVGAATAPV